MKFLNIKRRGRACRAPVLIKFCILHSAFCIFLLLAAGAGSGAEDQTNYSLKCNGNVHIGFGVPGHGPVTLKGNLAIIPPGEGDFTVLDVSDKTKPKVVGFVPSPFFSQAIFLYQDLGFFHNSRGGTFAADFSRPASRDEINNVNYFPFKSVNYLEDKFGRIVMLNAAKGYFIARAGEKFGVFGLDDPYAPKQISETQAPAEFKVDKVEFLSADVAIVGLARKTAAPTLGAEPKAGETITGLEDLNYEEIGNKLYRLDFADPAAPAWKEIMLIAPEERLLTAAEGKVALWNSKDKKIRVCVFSSDKRKYVEQARFALPERCGSHVLYAFNKNLLYLIDGKDGPGQYGISYKSGASRWLVYDLKDGELKPSFIWEAKNPSAFGSLQIADDYAYINDYNLGVWIFSLKNPGRPELISSAPTAAEGSGVYVDAKRKLAFMWVTFGGTIYAIDVSDPQKPRKLGYYWDGAWADYSNYSRACYIDGKDNVVYCAKNPIEIIDASDPTQLAHSGFLKDAHGKEIGGQIRVEDDALYVAAGTQFLVYDIKQADKPALAGAVDLPQAAGGIYSFYVKDKIAYLMGSSNALAVIDAHEPAQPAVAGVLDLNPQFLKEMGHLAHVAVSRKGYGYITTGGEGRGNTRLLVADLREPARPKALKWVDSKSGGFWGWACENSNMEIDEARQVLFVCKYMQVEAFSIADPENPAFLTRNHLTVSGADDWQWTIGPYIEPYLYVPSLRALFILSLEKAAPPQPPIPATPAETKAAAKP